MERQSARILKEIWVDLSQLLRSLLNRFDRVEITSESIKYQKINIYIFNLLNKSSVLDALRKRVHNLFLSTFSLVELFIFLLSSIFYISFAHLLYDLFSSEVCRSYKFESHVVFRTQ